MAIVTNNIVLHGAHGGIGKQFVVRQVNGKALLCKYPDFSRYKPSPAQREARDRFRDASAYASGAMREPGLAAQYRAVAKKRGMAGYTIALGMP